MAITRSSILHGWSSRYGINPRIGYRPVFTRTTSGSFVSQEGESSIALPNTPRFDWETLNLPNGVTERRKVLSLELAETNLQISSNNVAGGFSPRSGTQTANAAVGPDGLMSATLFTPSTSASYCGGGSYGVNVNGRTFAVSVWLRSKSGAKTVNFGILSQGDGGVGISSTTVIDEQWRKYSIVATGSVVTTAFYSYYQSVSDTNPFYIWGFDVKESPALSSLVTTVGSSAARGADVLYYNHPSSPQAMIGYVRFVERGTILISGARILELCAANETGGRFIVYNSGAGYRVYHDNGTTQVFSTQAVAINIGDTVEIVFALTAAGVALIILSINGAAVVAGASSATNTLPAAWGDTRLYLNSAGTSAGGYGNARFSDVKIVKYADVVASTNQGWMDELRALEFDLNGDLI